MMRHLPDDFASLAMLVRRRGLLRPTPGYYMVRTWAHVGLLVACAAGAAALRANLLAVLSLALLSALAKGQLGLMFHDAGHNQMFRAPWKNWAMGAVIANFVIGVSIGWWITKHQRHHLHPNEVDRDPDIGLKLHAYCEQQLQVSSWFLRQCIKYQAVLLPLLICFESLNTKVDSVMYLAKVWGSKRARIEAALMAAHYVVTPGFAILMIGPLVGPLFLLVSQLALGVYLSLLFLPNHIGRPVLEEGTKLDYFRRQVITARNFSPHPVTDYLYGPLMYQIEHHVFPRAPLPRLKEIREIVKAYCAERSIDYCEAGVVRSYVDVLSYLHQVSAPLRRRSAP